MSRRGFGSAAIVLALTALLAGAAGAAPEAKSVFRTANAAYQQGDYVEARHLYEKVLAAGADSASVRFNLGNACYKLQDYASAVLHYEKALKESPLDPDIRFNLKLSRMNILDKEQNGMANPFGIFYSFLMNLLPLNLLVVLLLAGLAGVGLLFWWRFGRRANAGTGTFLAATAWLSLGLFCLVALKSVYVETRHEAVVMQEEVTVYSGPGDNFPNLFNLHQGSKVLILQEGGGWYNIRFGSDFQGWLPAKDCARI